MDRKYQIFISSTYEDLIEIRKAIQDEILKMEQFPIGMELFSASGKPPWDIIEKTIDCSDYYLLIIGLRYGSETEDGISYTQKEFENAKDKGIPILAFIRNEDVSTTSKEREVDPKKQNKLKKFREIVSNNNERTVEWWDDKNDLIGKISKALLKAIINSPQPGWIRVDKSHTVIENIKLHELREELTILKSRQPVIECLIDYLGKESKGSVDNEDEVGVVSKDENIQQIQHSKVVINGISGLRLALESEHRSKEFMEDALMILNDKISDSFKPYIKQEILEKFSVSIKSEEDAEKYCRKLTKHYRLSMAADLLSLNIYNSGNTPANNLHVFIYFPDACLVMTKSQKRKAEKKEKEFIPVVNPLIQARNAKPSHMRFLNGTTRMFSTSLSAQSLRFVGNEFTDIDFRDLTSPSEFYIKENCIHVTLKRLTHTLQHELSHELYAIPIEKGLFSIRIEIICDELPVIKVCEILLEIV